MLVCVFLRKDRDRTDRDVPGYTLGETLRALTAGHRNEWNAPHTYAPSAPAAGVGSEAPATNRLSSYPHAPKPGCLDVAVAITAVS